MTYIRFRTILACNVALLAVLIVSAPAFAQTSAGARKVAQRINAANSLLRAGKVDDAIQGYRGVVPADNQRDPLNYNLAVAEYRKGNIEAAEQLFTEVAGTGSATLAADSRYNLGNCQYSTALQIAEKDKPAAIERLRHAIANYRGTVRANRNTADARANIELAGELIRMLEEQQKQEQQQQQQQDPSPESESQQDQSSSDSKPQKSDSQDSGSEPQEEKSQQRDEPSADEQSEQKEPAEQQPGEEQQREQTGESQPGADDQKTNEPGDSDRTPETAPGKSTPPSPAPQGSDDQSQQSQQQQQPSGDPPPADEEASSHPQQAEDQSVPTGDLKAAGEPDQNQKPLDTVGRDDQRVKDGLMTYEEALKMLQAVRDRDMLRRLQQERRERSRRVPVEKDW